MEDANARLKPIIDTLNSGSSIMPFTGAYNDDFFLRLLSCRYSEDCIGFVKKNTDLDKSDSKAFLTQYGCSGCDFHERRSDGSQKIQQGKK